MCATLTHRGPDAEGLYLGEGVGLGQRRLAIIDLSDAAVPPLSNEDGTVWVVFNGEIYNFREIRRDLELRGHRFRTVSDTEVLVHLYEEYGERCVQHLKGMFAFAIWDAPRARLFLARDRLGKKPLYYAVTAGSLTFGSEIKAITAAPGVSVAPNYAAIDAYLQRQYVPSPLTAFKGIRKLPAGHYAVCGRGGQLEVVRYWQPPGPSIDPARTRDDLLEELRQRIREAVRIRMISDVPLGAFLSGGIDSGLVVALMASETSERVKTFSIGFEEAEFNELSYARMVARRYATDHHELVLRPELGDLVTTLVRHYNEPFADSSAIPTFCVSRMARADVTVALTGDGGDESFGGYEHYAATQRWAAADLPGSGPLRRLAGWLARGLGALPYERRLSRVRRGLAMVSADLHERYRMQTAFFKDDERESLYAPQFAALSREGRWQWRDQSPEWLVGDDSLTWMTRHDLTNYLPDCLMTKTDVASMANSLEVRCPLLDHELVEFAARIPSRWKRDDTGGKLILKEAAAEWLPAEVLAKKKTGFGIPLALWLRTELWETLRGTLTDEVFRRRGLFQPRFVSMLLRQHREGSRDWSSRLWALLTLELWFREFVD